jgi:hypothetical protein
MRWLWSFPGAVVLVACGGHSPPPPDLDGGAELTACPATFAATNGHTCARDGMQCSISIECTPANQEAHCNCLNGVFQCVDPMGTIAPGESPRCTSGPMTDDQECPPTFTLAQGVACTQVGFTCVYEGADCPGRPLPVQDYCQCKLDRNDDTMRLACSRGLCAIQPTSE